MPHGGPTPPRTGAAAPSPPGTSRGGRHARNEGFRACTFEAALRSSYEPCLGGYDRGARSDNDCSSRPGATLASSPHASFSPCCAVPQDSACSPADLHPGSARVRVLWCLVVDHPGGHGGPG